jgi:hypothetical protein
MTESKEIPIPEEFLEWARLEALGYQHRHPANTGLMTDHDFREGATAAYRHLSPRLSSIERAGMEWVKVLDHLPDHDLGTVHCRTKYGRAVNKFAEGKFWWLDSKEVWQLSENTTHWLDESTTSSTRGSGEGGWISVEECKPELGIEVIGYFPEKTEGGKYVDLAYHDGENLISTFPNSTAYCFVATLWQPLPAAPVKEGGAANNVDQK